MSLFKKIKAKLKSAKPSIPSTPPSPTTTAPIQSVQNSNVTTDKGKGKIEEEDGHDSASLSSLLPRAADSDDDDDDNDQRQEITNAAIFSRKKSSSTSNGKTKKDIWLRLLKHSISKHGKIHLKTSKCMLDLGHYYMTNGKYHDALASFKSAVRIRRSILGNHHVSVARALDGVGLAAAKLHETDWAILALHESLVIRHASLGPWNVDVAETLNNIAGIHAQRGELIMAERAYVEVLSVRKAVFGAVHPSVGVTYCALAGVFMRLTKLDDALCCYHDALRIYRYELKLSDRHPTMVKLLRDMTRTERIMVSMGC